MNIYLDIDGVILANDKQIANYSEDFIKHLVTNHNVYWLTTHCRGNTLYTCNLLKKILPTYWEINKTEAIDFSKPFLWFDDDLYKNENQLAKYLKI
jgi:hypothetical protein